MKKLPLTFSLLLTLAITAFSTQATLIGDSINGELLTQFAGTFPVTTATVGADVEFSRTFSTAVGPGDPFVELDVHSDSFTFRFVNPIDTSFNLGLLGIQLNDLDWVDNPTGEITGLTLLSSSFPESVITGFGYGSHDLWVNFNSPIIPGFGTEWSAIWSIQTNEVPLPSILSLLVVGLSFMGLFGKRKSNTSA